MSWLENCVLAIKSFPRIGYYSKNWELENENTARHLYDMTDDEWDSGMKRMSDVFGKVFSNVDVDEYVNSFRR